MARKKKRLRPGPSAPGAGASAEPVSVPLAPAAGDMTEQSTTPGPPTTREVAEPDGTQATGMGSAPKVERDAPVPETETVVETEQDAETAPVVETEPLVDTQGVVGPPLTRVEETVDEPAETEPVVETQHVVAPPPTRVDETVDAAAETAVEPRTVDVEVLDTEGAADMTIEAEPARQREEDPTVEAVVGPAPVALEDAAQIVESDTARGPEVPGRTPADEQGTTPDRLLSAESPQAEPPAAVAEPQAPEALEGPEQEGETPPPPGSESLAPAPVLAYEGADTGEVVARPAQGAAAWRRLVRMGQPRATRANVLGALLAILLGLAIATQVQLTQERGLNALSQSELIRVLDDVSVRSSRLDAQLRELETTRDRLKSGTGSSAEALEQAQKRVDTLGILAGTVGARGPGVTITLSDPKAALTGPNILDLIQELRDAGAEAIDVGGVRVVASTYIGEIDGDIAVDGVPVKRPIVIKAIGDSNTMSSAMTIPGGIVETVRQAGAKATVTEADTIEITSLHTVSQPKHARPAE